MYTIAEFQSILKVKLMVNLPSLHVQCWKAVIFSTVLVVAKMSGLELLLSSNTVVPCTG